MSSRRRTALCAAFALTVLANATAVLANAPGIAQTSPPAVPITRFPGADFSRITCTPAPGPPLHETRAVRRQILTFLNDAQQGRFDSAIVSRGLRTTGTGGMHRFFAQLGPVRALRFRGAGHGCSYDAASYRYHVTGRDRAADLWFSISSSHIDGYGQLEPRR